MTAACSGVELFDKDSVGTTGRIFCRNCLESGIVCCFAHGQAGLTVLGGKITWFQWPSAHTQSRGCVCCHQRDLSLTMLTLVTGLRCWLSGSPCCPLWREVTYVHQRFIPIPPWRQRTNINNWKLSVMSICPCIPLVYVFRPSLPSVGTRGCLFYTLGLD